MINNFLNFLKESSNSGMDYLQQIAALTSGNQGEFFKWQVNNAKNITISPTPGYIDKGNPQLKNCYKNSFAVIDKNYDKDILYVEGLIMLGNIPIEHSWNKIGDIYFDVTQEIKNIKFEGYTSIIELTEEQVCKYMEITGRYGSYLKQAFLDIR